MNLSRAVLYSLKMNSLFKIGNRSLRLLNTGVCHQRPLHNFSFHLLGDSTLETFGRNHKVECRLESLFFQPVRFYAKSKDRQKGAKGQKKKVHINEEELNEVINTAAMKEQMEGSIEKLKEEFIKNLSLRSTSGSIESLPISFEGKDYVLQDLAQVVRKNPKTVVINMSAFPQVIPAVIQAISKSGMNLSPQQDGTTLFIPIPKVTKEHRENLSKNAKALFIKCRDSIKDVQNKFIKTVKNKEKAGVAGLSQDTAISISDFITSTATEYISMAEKLLQSKQQELLKEQ